MKMAVFFFCVAEESNYGRCFLFDVLGLYNNATYNVLARVTF
jgi:hypothetical protein